MIPLRDHNPTRIFPFLTLLLIAANILVFFMELTTPNFERFIFSYALVPADVRLADPSTWTGFLTSMFMHAGWLHIISNLWFLWIFGNNLEEALGRIKFLFTYIASGLAGALLQFFLNPDSTIPMLGASAAIAGVLGGYLVLFPRHRIDTLVPSFGFLQLVALPAMLMIGYWFLLQILSGAGSLASSSMDRGGVAFFAHIGGFVAGWIFTKVFTRNRPRPATFEYIR